MQILFSENFRKKYRKFTPIIQACFDKKLRIFIVNQKHPSLRIHKLKGRLQFCFSLSVNLDIRALFTMENGVAEFFAIGTHDEVY